MDQVDMLVYPFAVHVEELINSEDILLTIILAQVSKVLLATLFS